MNVENGKYASWTISCPMDSSYDTHVKENFSNQITWSMPCKTVYQMAISDSQIFSGALDLLEVSGFDSFKLENQSGKIVNVANNIINDASQNLVIPVDFDSDNAVFRNYETYKNFVCWVENDTPITIQGTNTSTSNIVLTGNSSALSIDALANAKATFSTSSWHDGGNDIEIKPMSNEAVTIKNHYYDYGEDYVEYVFQIEGLVTDVASVTESANGTQIKGFSSAELSIEQNGTKKETYLDDLTDFNSIFVNIEDSGNSFTIVVGADTNGDNNPDTILDIDISSSTMHTVTFNPNGGSCNMTNLITEKNGKLSILPIANRNGYAFDGWYTAISDGDKITTDHVFTSDTTVYAHWTKNGGSSSSGNSSGSGSSGVGSSGGGSSSTSYSITTGNFAHGSISTSPKNASKGTKVTITATPDTGYRLEKLAITDNAGNELELTSKGNDKYTFTMPAGTVKVEASFVPIETAEVPWVNPFTDVAESAWYYNAVRFVNENNLMGGYGNGLFGVNDNLSRVQLAQILYNKEGKPLVSDGNSFSDVDTGAWYTNAVTWAAANGIVSGYGNGMFGPNDPITREQLAVMLWRYSGSPAAINKELRFFDAGDASDYALEALRWAVENSIINGYGNGQLGPKGQATRAQVAQMLRNYLER